VATSGAIGMPTQTGNSCTRGWMVGQTGSYPGSTAGLVLWSRLVERDFRIAPGSRATRKSQRNPIRSNYFGLAGDPESKSDA